MQEWIAAGKPVNPPPLPAKGRRSRTPLEVALDLGFHSLIEVLLKGGAILEPDGCDSPMHRALSMRRLDVTELLVEHGADPCLVDMRSVLGTWNPTIMAYFIDRGGDVETGNPFAWAFCNRIRSAFGVFKHCRERLPRLQEHANIALRHHCKEGNLKWISLMLWLGADPLKPGAQSCNEEITDDDDCGTTALTLAAIYNHLEIFALKKIKLDPAHPEVKRLVQFFGRKQAFDLLIWLLERGLDPNDQENGGSSSLHYWLHTMSLHIPWDPWSAEKNKRKLDTDHSRERIKAIHLLAKHGAKWCPKDKREVGTARRSLLKLIPDYTAEFIWIMAKYKACHRESAESLIRTPSMKAHIKNHCHRVQELIASLDE